MREAASRSADTAASDSTDESLDKAIAPAAAASVSLILFLKRFIAPAPMIRAQAATFLIALTGLLTVAAASAQTSQPTRAQAQSLQASAATMPQAKRSEERRVGKECVP